MGWARRIVGAIAFGLGWCACAHAATPDAPGAWEEAQSLRELPAGIQALLGVGLGGGDGIADQGDSFNAGDVVADNSPMRRFVLGIVNGSTAVVAVEQGGIGYSVQVLEFHQDGSTWEPARCTAGFGVPRHGADLLDAFKAQTQAAVSSAVPSCRMVNGHVAVAAGAVPAVAPTAAPAAPVHAAPHVRPRPGA